MNWIFYDRGVKPKHLEECFAIESRERQIVSCYWNDREKQFYSYDKYGEIFYLGPFEDYDNYVLAWIPASEVINDYMEAKSKQNAK